MHPDKALVAHPAHGELQLGGKLQLGHALPDDLPRPLHRRIDLGSALNDPVHLPCRFHCACLTQDVGDVHDLHIMTSES